MSEWVQWIQLDAGEFPRLQELEVINCPNLIGGLPKRVPSLARLKVEKCPGLVASLERATCIHEVVLEECEGVQFEMQGVSSIEILKIMYFASLEEFAIELSTLTHLKELRVENCPRLFAFPEGMMRLNNLKKLTVRCNMVFFPRGGLPAPNLSCLRVQGCKKLKALPEQMHTLLPSLAVLCFRGCSEIESFPKGGLPSKLSSLFINDCKKLVGSRRDWGLQRLPSLQCFSLLGESKGVLESFLEEGLLPTTVTMLFMFYMPNLKSLNSRGLQLLGSLKYMLIWNCSQLQSLQEEGLPTSLLELFIMYCPLLNPHCRRKEKTGIRLLMSLLYVSMVKPSLTKSISVQ
ncbi:hypothetical protein RHGRI_010635 [Rhododendron griersonianum]|uniref:Disease resistance protein At3g14460 n=1 Tax=Rhododendron griersonianum TaxID=479676 RepID=A0AAV6KK38_9ERIC|nr:hypothetical protein RHGRI_010635 [Rhododendron griersonianum]